METLKHIFKYLKTIIFSQKINEILSKHRHVEKFDYVKEEYMFF